MNSEAIICAQGLVRLAWTSLSGLSGRAAASVAWRWAWVDYLLAPLLWRMVAGICLFGQLGRDVHPTLSQAPSIITALPNPAFLWS